MLNAVRIGQLFDEDDGQAVEFSAVDPSTFMVPIVVDGQETEVPLKDLQASYQIRQAAQHRLTKAQELLTEAEAFKKSNEERSRLGDLVVRLRQGDPDAQRELAEFWNLDPQAVAGATRSRTPKSAPSAPSALPDEDGAGAAPADPYLEKLAQALRIANVDPAEFVTQAVGRLRQQAKADDRMNLRNLLDTHPALRKILSGQGADDLIDTTDALLRERLAGGTPYSPRIGQEVLEKVARLVAGSGTSAQPKVTPGQATNFEPSPGMGPLPPSGGAASLPGHSPRPLKRPSATDGSDARLAWIDGRLEQLAEELGGSNNQSS